MGEAKPNFAGLDLVRFAAAAMVMWYHLAWWSWFNPEPTVAPGIAFPELASSASFGGVGVEIFFVLSGFVIALTAEGRTPAQFARSRFLRLYPTAWVCATITLLALVAYSAFTPLQLFAAWVRTLLIWPFDRKVDGVYWTLTVEIVFYAMVWLLIAARQWKHFDAFLIALGIPGTLVLAAWVGGADITWFYESTAARLSLVRHGFLFSLGGLMWLAWKGRASGLHYAAMALFLCAGAASILASPGKAPLLSCGVWLASIAVMAASIRWHAPIAAAFGRALSAVRLIGLATYPLYLLHNVCGLALMRLAVDLGAPGYAALAFAIVAVTLASFAVAAWIEPWVKDATERAMAWRPVARRVAGH